MSRLICTYIGNVRLFLKGYINDEIRLYLLLARSNLNNKVRVMNASVIAFFEII